MLDERAVKKSRTAERGEESRLRIDVVRVELVRERRASFAGAVIRGPRDVVRLIQPFIGRSDRERFLALFLSSRHAVNALHEAGVRSIDSTPAAVIVAHNHPSGDAEPSEDDIAVTKRLVEAGRLLGVDVLDHVVVGEKSYVSLHERGVV